MSFAFEGRYDEHETQLSNNVKLAAHLIHSCLHLLLEKRRLGFVKGICLADFFEANKEALNSICARYERERGYRITYLSIKMGIEMFLKSAANYSI